MSYLVKTHFLSPEIDRALKRGQLPRHYCGAKPNGRSSSSPSRADVDCARCLARLATEAPEKTDG